jgi:hypothetical protein
MPSKVSERPVTEFLRDALAAAAVGVPKLEAMARAAGLLSERQRITDAKVFRRAKILLGIRSIRDGFGPRGGWAWELPSNREESAASSSPVGPQRKRKERLIPREWVEGVARLDQNQPPADVPRHRWRQFVDDCNGFLNSPEAERAAQLGWHTIRLFGCKPSYPLSYLGQAGLLWHLGCDRWSGQQIATDLLPAEHCPGANHATLDGVPDGTKRVFSRAGFLPRISGPMIEGAGGRAMVYEPCVPCVVGGAECGQADTLFV